jgi:hypothetical protein
MLRPIALATAISGTLDILFATLLTLWFGRYVGAMLRYVASGPFPAAIEWGPAGAILGLVVHFTLMAMMAAVFMLAAGNIALIRRSPVIWGLGYGLVTYGILDLVVVPLRFPAAWPPSTLSIATQLFAHLILVGLVFGLVARRSLRRRASWQ